MGRRLPGGCRVTVTYFYTSDKLKQDATYRLPDRDFLPDIDGECVDDGFDKLPSNTDDWRRMSDDEILRFLAGNDEFNDHGEVEF